MARSWERLPMNVDGDDRRWRRGDDEQRSSLMAVNCAMDTATKSKSSLFKSLKFYIIQGMLALTVCIFIAAALYLVYISYIADKNLKQTVDDFSIIPVFIDFL
jgi:hypothetical protein